MFRLIKLSIIICSFIFVSCSSDDVNDFSLITSEYEQPILEFDLLDIELFDILGEPDLEVNLVESSIAKYSINSNGVSEHVYYFISNPDTPNDYRYYKVDVRFVNSQHNFDFMLKLLTNDYGNPEITENLDTETKSYSWVNNSTLFVNLYYVPENNNDISQVGILQLTYQNLSE